MLSLNRVELIGHLGSAPKTTRTNTGRPVANLRLCTNKTWKDDEGKRQEREVWHQLTVWAPGLIERVLPHLGTGSYIRVVGELNYQTFEKDGQEHKAAEIIVREIGFLEPRATSEAEDAGAVD
ncbi:MAG: single-stranded DNA-binding protein [Phycisphaerales bacterium]|jgi:single-strand DNA-binding protein